MCRRMLALVLTTWLLIGYAEAQDSKPAEKTSEAKADVNSGAKPVTTVDPDIPVDQLKVMVKPLTKAELQVEADAWFKLLQSKARQIAAARLGVKKTNAAITSGDDRAANKTLQQVQEVRQRTNEQAAEENPSDDAGAATDESTTDESTTDESATDESTTDESATDESTTDENAPEETSPAGGSPADTVTATAATVKEELLAYVTTLQAERTAISDRLEVVLHSLVSKGGDAKEYREYAAAVSGVELDTSDATAAWAGIMGWLTSKEGGQRWAWNLVKFILILVVTYFVAKLVASVVNWLLERKIKLSQLAERLISNVITNLIMLVGFAVGLTALEIDITPILAAIGATGLVVGLALQGTLSNFASGLMILINRPFDVGDVVTAGGITGTVHQMNLVSTTFRTFDNQTIHVPNNEIWNNVITNITANDTRRVDLEFGIGYDDDFEQAENIIKEVAAGNELVLKDPEPVVVMHALADSSVNIVCRPWAKTGDWWKVKTDVTREVKRRFDQAGISIPYPQQDVHVYSIDGADGSDAKTGT